MPVLQTAKSPFDSDVAHAQALRGALKVRFRRNTCKAHFKFASGNVYEMF